MLQKFADSIKECLSRAEAAERRAADASDAVIRLDNEKMAKNWRHLAHSYQFVETLQRFLLDAAKHKRSSHPVRQSRESVPR